jgi:hypothetical protein
MHAPAIAILAPTTRRPARAVLVALVAAVLLAAGAAPAARAATPPQATYALGSPGMVAAQALAKAHWGMDPCGGQVLITWKQLEPDINAISTWSNPRSSYDDPALNGDCSIDFNTRAPYDWEMFCTVVVHEYGHLSGKPHSNDENDVMAPIYSVPLPECVKPPAVVTGDAASAAAAQPARRVVKRATVARKTQAARKVARTRATKAKAAKAKAAKARASRARARVRAARAKAARARAAHPRTKASRRAKVAQSRTGTKRYTHVHGAHDH